MREILFHGKRIDNGEWFEGSLILAGECSILGMDWPYLNIRVISDTIGQYIGRQDKNGKKIFEGHIVEHAGKLYVIEYIEKYSRFAPTRPEIVFAGFDLGACEIVGDIHDHPDLLQAVFPKRLQALSVQERQRVFLGKWGKGDTP